MDYKDTKESKLQEAIKGIKEGCNEQFYKKDEDKIEELAGEISFVRQVNSRTKSESGVVRWSIGPSGSLIKIAVTWRSSVDPKDKVSNGWETVKMSSNIVGHP